MKLTNNKKYKSLLIISDLHAPFIHPDAVRFLTAIKKKYSPDGVVLIGDQVDQHSLSQFVSDPNGRSTGDEVSAARKSLQPIFKLFPEAFAIFGNHDLRASKRAQEKGLSEHYLRPLSEVYQTPAKWVWSHEIMLRLSNGEDVRILHNSSSKIAQKASMTSCSLIQGHFHSSFGVEYVANPYKLLWGMTTGCLVDEKAYAFAYGKNSSGTDAGKKSIIGCGIVIDGHPKLLPMPLNSYGRWAGVLL